MPTVAVLGLWHLGSVAAASWAALGRRVIAWDPSRTLREMVRAGTPPVAEPGLGALLAEQIRAGRLAVADQAADAIGASTVVHLAFDSRLDAQGRVCDGRIEAAVERVSGAAAPGSLLMISSQVQVGTCRGFARLLTARGRRDLRLAYLPENLRLGAALTGFCRPSRLVVGVDDDASWRAATTALTGIEGPRLRLDLPSAELAKHATNAYLAMCISFANEVAWVARAHGADPGMVMDAVRADDRVSPRAPLAPGAAFSGGTLRRDLVALLDAGTRAGRPDLFQAVLTVNERHAGLALELVRGELGSLPGRRVAVLGLTYKAGTSTLRDSLPLRLVRQLAAEGARSVSGYDPIADPIEDPPAQFTRAPTVAGCVADADAVVVFTPLPEVVEAGWLTAVARRSLVVDAGGVLDPRSVRAAGWRYLGLTATDH